MAKPQPLFLTDAQVAELVGLSTDEWKAAAIVLERDGLPTKDPLQKPAILARGEGLPRSAVQSVGIA